MQKEKQTVAITSILASAVMTIGKFTVGLMTGSLGLISEGLHSLLDLGATIMTFMAVRVSDKPADAEHPYGHGKAESVAALAETILLFVTSFWIVTEAGHRLIEGHSGVSVNWWAVGVIVASILIDLTRATALSRVAKRTKSQALEADALHFSSDVLSSAAVLLGLIGAWLGWVQADTVAALAVAVFVCRAGWKLGLRTIDTLIDAAPRGATERITRIAKAVPGVARVGRVRVRPAGSILFADVDVSVGRTLSQAHVFAVKQALVAAVRREMPEAELTVTSQPLALDSETVNERVMAIAAEQGVQVHHITVHQHDGNLSVSFDLEVDGQSTIAEAHTIATQMEHAIMEEFGKTTEVETHIEPLQDIGLTSSEVNAAELIAICALLEERIAASHIFFHCHNVRARRTSAGLILYFHCNTSPERTVTEVHEAADKLERAFRREHTGVWRIVVHTEPAGRDACPECPAAEPPK